MQSLKPLSSLMSIKDSWSPKSPESCFWWGITSHLPVRFYVEQCFQTGLTQMHDWQQCFSVMLTFKGSHGAELSKTTNPHRYCWHSWPWIIIITAHSDGSACTISPEPTYRSDKRQKERPEHSLKSICENKHYIFSPKNKSFEYKHIQAKHIHNSVCINVCVCVYMFNTEGCISF